MIEGTIHTYSSKKTKLGIWVKVNNRKGYQITIQGNLPIIDTLRIGDRVSIKKIKLMRDDED